MDLRYGRLTVQEMSHKDKFGIQFVTCVCDCGNEEDFRRTFLEYNFSVECSECKKKHMIKESANK